MTNDSGFVLSHFRKFLVHPGPVFLPIHSNAFERLISNAKSIAGEKLGECDIRALKQ